jgi:hypothetical protein
VLTACLCPTHFPWAQVREIPLFHGDQWEATVPSLLGLAPEDNANGRDKEGNLLRMDAKNVLQKAHQEMHHLKRHFLVVVFADLEVTRTKACSLVWHAISHRSAGMTHASSGGTSERRGSSDLHRHHR